MKDKKNGSIDRKIFTDVRSIRKDGVLNVPNYSPPKDPPGLKPVNVTPIKEKPAKKGR